MKENYNLYGYYVPQAPVNDEGLDKNGQLHVADPYNYGRQQNYSLKDIEGLYVIHKVEYNE